MQTIKLNNGIEMPIVGMGTNTFGKEGNDYSAPINGDTKELDAAIANGYRLIDTAISYRNESVIGDAVKKSGINREEFFLVSKIPGKAEYLKDQETVDETVGNSLKALQTDYIDLYLVHHPWDSLEEMATAWKALEKHVENGNIKSLGVSNFSEEQLAYIIEHGTIKPVVNQVQSHPGNWNDDIIEFGNKHQVYGMAWGPLSRVSDEAKAQITKIGEKYGKTWAQVVLNYQVDREVIIIPKSSNAERQKLNLDIFDFELTDDEKALLKSL